MTLKLKIFYCYAKKITKAVKVQITVNSTEQNTVIILVFTVSAEVYRFVCFKQCEGGVNSKS